MESLPTFPSDAKRPGRALLVEGGGMRGTFGGGALSVMTRHYPADNFDIVLGVSAGSCSAAYYVADWEADPSSITQILNIWRYELSGSRLMSYLNWIRGKRFLNQDYLIDLFIDKYALRRERLSDSRSTPFYVVLTNLKTLQPEYARATAENIYPLLRAATALPIATSGNRRFGDGLYSDGGVTDPVPIEALIRAGYRDITVLLTNPRDFRMSQPIGWLTAYLAFPRNRAAARRLSRHHHVNYNRSYELINHPPPGVKVRIIDPPHHLPAGMVDTDEGKLNEAVDLGVEIAYDMFVRGEFDRRKSRSWWDSVLRTFGLRSRRAPA